MIDLLRNEHRQIARMLTPWLLVGSGLLSIWAGLLSPQRSMPDERHHIAYATYLYKQPLPFPPRLEQIYTGPQRDYNHIKHPPLYYYYLAGLLALSDYDADFSLVGREHDVFGSNRTARVTVPLLRLASWLLMALGLWGSLRLLRYLDAQKLLDPWWGMLFVLMTSFIPGWLFIGGAINNDVMVMALWPWLALALVRYQKAHNSLDFWIGVILIGLLVLTKATAWLLALVVALTFAGLALRTGQWRRLLHARSSQLVAAGALVVAMLVAVFLLSNLTRYGKLQPSYLEVHQLDLRESKFWTLPKDAPEPQISWNYTFEQANYYLMRGWTGVLSHRDLIEKPHLAQLGLLARIAWLLLMAAFCVALGKEAGRSWLLPLVLVLPMQYLLMLAFNHAIYPKYLVHAMEGRYLIGSVHISLLAVLLGLQGDRRITLGLTLVASSIWMHVFFDPMLFNRHTTAYVRDSQIIKSVSEQLRKQGMTAVKVAYGVPARAGERQRNHGLPPHYQLKSGQQLVLEIEGSQQLYIYAEGLLSADPTALKVQSEQSSESLTLGYDAEILQVQVTGQTTLEAQGNLRIYAIWQSN